MRHLKRESGQTGGIKEKCCLVQLYIWAKALVEEAGSLSVSTVQSLTQKLEVQAGLKDKSP